MKSIINNQIGREESEISEAMKSRSQAIFSFQKNEPATYKPQSTLHILYNIN